MRVRKDSLRFSSSSSYIFSPFFSVLVFRYCFFFIYLFCVPSLPLSLFLTLSLSLSLLLTFSFSLAHPPPPPSFPPTLFLFFFFLLFTPFFLELWISQLRKFIGPSDPIRCRLVNFFSLSSTGRLPTPPPPLLLPPFLPPSTHPHFR